MAFSNSMTKLLNKTVIFVKIYKTGNIISLPLVKIGTLHNLTFVTIYVNLFFGCNKFVTNRNKDCTNNL